MHKNKPLGEWSTEELVNHFHQPQWEIFISKHYWLAWLVCTFVPFVLSAAFLLSLGPQHHIQLHAKLLLPTPLLLISSVISLPFVEYISRRSIHKHLHELANRYGAGNIRKEVKKAKRAFPANRVCIILKCYSGPGHEEFFMLTIHPERKKGRLFHKCFEREIAEESLITKDAELLQTRCVDIQKELQATTITKLTNIISKIPPHFDSKPSRQSHLLGGTAFQITWTDNYFESTRTFNGYAPSMRSMRGHHVQLVWELFRLSKTLDEE